MQVVSTHIYDNPRMLEQPAPMEEVSTAVDFLVSILQHTAIVKPTDVHDISHAFVFLSILCLDPKVSFKKSSLGSEMHIWHISNKAWLPNGDGGGGVSSFTLSYSCSSFNNFSIFEPLNFSSHIY